MSVRHFETHSTDPYERGRELGAGRAAGIAGCWDRYRELWAAYAVTPAEVRSVGEAVLQPIAEFSSALRAEIAGIAAGADLAEWQVAALNARSELLALGDQRLLATGALPGEPVSECSTLVQLPDGGSPISAQTWDWHATLHESWFVWTLRLPSGRTVHTLTEYGIVGKIGLAVDPPPRSGIGVHFNALRHRDDSGRGGVPAHVVSRRVLDEASTIADAAAIASDADVTASAAITVTARDDHGDWSARTVELYPGGPAVLEHSDGDHGSWLAHTNHFVAGGVGPDAGVTSELSTSRERLDRVAVLARTTDPSSAGCLGTPQPLAEKLATHDLGERSVCVHGFPQAPIGQRAATLAVVVAEPAAGRLHVHAGKACETRTASWWSNRG